MSNPARGNHSLETHGQGIARLGEDQENQIRVFIQDIVRRTRLWKSEKNQVFLELLDHFHDGADAGHSADELLRDFGSPQLAAQLIRKSKIRSRAWQWHFWNRAFQITACTFCMAIVGMALLMWRLHQAKPGKWIDPVGAMDALISQIPDADRGWPEYREGLTKLDRLALQTVEMTRGLGGSVAIDDPAWPQVVKYLDANQPAFQHFLKGASRPRLGYFYRDPNNDTWLKTIGNRSSRECYPDQVFRIAVLLPHIQDLALVRSIFHAAALRALTEKNLKEFDRCVVAQRQLGVQLLNESEYLVVKLMGRAVVNDSLALVRRLVVDYGALLNDEQLASYKKSVIENHPETKMDLVNELRAHFDELLQAVFAPEAEGGQFTATGVQIMRENLAFVSQGDSFRETALKEERDAAGLDASASTPVSKEGTMAGEVVFLRWSLNLAHRKDQKAEFERFLNLLEAAMKECASSQTKFTDTEYHEELRRLVANPSQRRKYWPVFLYLPSSGEIFIPEQAVESARMHREGTVATIALEQYRRRTGHWPESLDKLVPADLALLPIDAFSSKPLVYRVVDGKPLLYSVYRDRDDDGGKPVPMAAAPEDGDWRLVPVD